MKPACHQNQRVGSFFAGVLALAVARTWNSIGTALVQPLLGGGLPLQQALVVRRARFHDPDLEARKARKAEKRKRVEETKFRGRKKSGFSAFSLEELHQILETLQVNTRRVDMSDKRAVIKKLLKIGVQPGDVADMGASRRSVHFAEKAASGSSRRAQSTSRPPQHDAFEDATGALHGKAQPSFIENQQAGAEGAAEATMAHALKEGWRPQDLSVRAAQVLLGVPTPSSEAVRAAKKRLALKWHPDVNTEHPKAADAFALIIKAADLLL